MEVSVEILERLERRLQVTISADSVASVINDRLQRLAGSIEIDGFAPGSAPLSAVEEKFGAQIRREVLDEMIESTLKEALAQKDLKPVGDPDIVRGDTSPGQSFEYHATFEVFPDIELNNLAGEVIEKPVAQVMDQDVANLFEKLQAQQAVWSPVSRPAVPGDQLVVDFEGTIDGQAYSANKGSSVEVMLGSGTMLAGFEDKLAGCVTGDHRTLNLQFPADYLDKNVAGKDAVFEVDVRQVLEMSLPTIDDAFANSFNVDGGIEAFRSAVRENLAFELQQAISTKLKRQVLDRLVSSNSVDVPSSLLRQEIENLKAKASDDDDNMSSGTELPDELFEEQARKRVMTGLLLSEIIKIKFLQLDYGRVQTKLEELAHGYEDPDQVINMYQQDPDKMKTVETLVLEDQVVESLLEGMEVREISQTFADIMSD